MLYLYLFKYGMYFVCSMYYAYDNFLYIYRITYNHNYYFGINVIILEETTE